MLRRLCLRARCAISRLKWIPDLKQPTQHHADSQLRSIFSYCVMKELLHVNVVYCRHISLGRDRTRLLSLTGSDLSALSRRSDKNRGIHERVCTEEQLLQVCCDGADIDYISTEPPINQSNRPSLSSSICCLFPGSFRFVSFSGITLIYSSRPKLQCPTSSSVLQLQLCYFSASHADKTSRSTQPHSVRLQTTTSSTPRV